MRVEEWKKVEKSLKLELGAEELYNRFLANIVRKLTGSKRIEELDKLTVTNGGGR